MNEDIRFNYRIKVELLMTDETAIARAKQLTKVEYTTDSSKQSFIIESNSIPKVMKKFYKNKNVLKTLNKEAVNDITGHGTKITFRIGSRVRRLNSEFIKTCNLVSFSCLYLSKEQYVNIAGGEEEFRNMLVSESKLAIPEDMAKPDNDSMAIETGLTFFIDGGVECSIPTDKSIYTKLLFTIDEINMLNEREHVIVFLEEITSTIVKAAANNTIVNYCSNDTSEKKVFLISNVGMAICKN